MILFPSREILRRRADIGLIIAFVVFLWLPTADFFLHLDRAPKPKENRDLAAFPKFRANLAGIGKFCAGFDSFFSDNFGFRRQLVRWEQRLRWSLFHDPTRNATVLIGRDGWLFYSDGRTVEDITGAKPFTEPELAAWRDLLIGRRDWLRARGIRYLFIIAADKQSIYPEHLPGWLTEGGRTPQRLTQFVNYMRQHTDLPILDLRETMLNTKTTGDIYLRTDTHWNDRGAYAGYKRITQELAKLGLPGTPLDAESFRETTEDLPGGDLARMLGREALMTEKSAPILSPNPSRPFSGPIEAEDILRKKWPEGMGPRITENPSAQGRLLLFRDSFCQHLLKFFALGYRRSVFIWQPHWDKPLIEREKPDIVIDEMVERFLIFRSPEVLKSADEDPNAPMPDR